MPSPSNSSSHALSFQLLFGKPLSGKPLSANFSFELLSVKNASKISSPYSFISSSNSKCPNLFASIDPSLASFALDTEPTPRTGTTTSRIQLRLPLVSFVPDYLLQDEVQAQDLLSLVQAEENDTVENYSNPEAPQQLPVLDERLGESFDEETMTHPIALETTRDPPPATAKEPVGEQLSTHMPPLYAKLRAKGQSGPSMHPAPVVKTSLVVSKQAHSFSQHSHPAIFPKNSGSEAIEEALVVEDEVDSRSIYIGNLPSSISTSDLEQVFKNFGKLRLDGVFIRSRKESNVFYAFIEYQDAIGVQNALKVCDLP
ncbi:hypothetical protein ZIOFF_022238 [Zingiber officinale]|uniref:RRM domain-containing protein n=1 Tax=Zingiber officinale TaxID=94328 RepID=A0A8J5HCQ5_ZINOF|nr:hypothetical protein ZIOFF_022238 [Zingiber officinale]